MSKGKKIEKLEEQVAFFRSKYQQNNEEKLRLANLLSRINHELEESLYNEKRFIASVSHELRTPMTAIIGYGELMSDTTLSSKQKRYLKSMMESSNHLLSLINDLLDVAKLEDRRIELSPKILELYDILNESATLIHSKISDEVKFIVTIPTLEYKIKADDKRLKQIVINLLSNAAKFTTKGSIEFYVESMVEVENNQLKIVLNVEDTGKGINQSLQEKLFQPFSSTDQTQGTGLGLYISQELARLMGGDIQVFSKEGVGTLFSFTFLVEKSVKKEIGKGLIKSKILMCSPQSSYVDAITVELLSMGVDGFTHYDIEKNGIVSLMSNVLRDAEYYDMVVFDADVFQQDTYYIAKMFLLANPKIKLLALMNDDSTMNTDIFNMVLYKPLGYQQFILEMETLYTQKVVSRSKKIDYSKLKILVVEDVELNRIYEAEMLNNFFGIRCDTAINGAIAVEKAKQNHYDAILMDLRMPIMGGLEATQKIRKFDDKTPIICMSANVYKEDKLEAYDAGMNAFIEKPLEKDDIENQLLKIINHELFENPSTVSLELNEEALIHLRKNFDETTTRMLFETAMISIDETLQNIQQRNMEEEMELLVEDFHRLKGILLNLGLEKLAKQADKLQLSAKNKELLESLDLKEHLMHTLTRLLL